MNYLAIGGTILLFALVWLSLRIYPLCKRLLRMYGMTAPWPAQGGGKHVISFGILGASRIAPIALIYPSRWISNKMRVYAVAARDEMRAAEFSKAYFVPKIHASYRALLTDEGVTAVYISTPNGSHFKWAKAALEAGKHVLVEKPMACNEYEVRELITCAKANGKVLMEAIHTFHHPAMLRARDIIRCGEIGSICEITCTMKSSIPYKDIRFNCAGSDPTLGGGAMMDNGVYCVHALQFLTDSYAIRVSDAHATQRFKGVDSRMDALLDFGAFTGRIVCAMDEILPCNFIPICTVQGSRGTLTIYNFILPHIWHRLNVRTSSMTRHESHYGDAGQTSWEYQLQEFVHCVETNHQDAGGCCRTRTGGPVDDPASVLRVMDDVYKVAGMKS